MPLRRHSARQEVRGDAGHVGELDGAACSKAQREEGGEAGLHPALASGAMCAGLSKA